MAGKRISADKRQLILETEKNKIISDILNCAVWEYDIATKTFYLSRKISGKHDKENLTIPDYRNQMLEWDLIYPDDIPAFNRYCDMMDRGKDSFTIDVRQLNDIRRYVWFRYTGRTVVDEDGKPYRVVGSTSDVTAIKRWTGIIDDQSVCDDITHLYNKSSVEEFAEALFKSGNAQNIPKLIMLIDIDDFMELKDRWGSVYSDSVLSQFAELIRRNFKAGDIIGHIEGDKFIVVCDDVASRETACRIAERFMHCVAAFRIDDKYGLKVSIGMSFFPDDGKDYQALFRTADIALYHAKENGGNKYSIYNSCGKNALAEYQASRSEEQSLKAEARKTSDIAEKERRLFDFSFETMTATENFYDAIGLIFREICISFGIDVVVMIEYDYSTSTAKATTEWYTDISEDQDELSRIYTKYWDLICRRYEDNDRFIYDYKQTDDVLAAEMDQVAGAAKSVMQIPMIDGNKVVAVINYTAYKNFKPWTYSETAALTSVTRMIASYFFKIRSRRELECETEYNSAAMKAQNSNYYVVDDEYRIVYLSESIKNIYPQLNLGEQCFETIGKCRHQCDACPIKGIQNNGGHNSYSIETYSEDDGRWRLLSAITLEEKHNKGRYLVCIADVTGFLTRVKYTDQLTGLMNYDRFVANAVRVTSRDNDNFVVAFLGICGFSQLNDEFGYSTGDRILRKLAGQLTAATNENELAARIKGDDFLVLLTYRKDISEAAVRINEIFGMISRLMKPEYPGMQLDFMCGLYGLRSSDYSFTTAVDRASKARKEAEKTPPDPYRIFIYSKEYEDKIRSESAFEAAMHEALINNEFKVFIQPKVMLPGGKIGGGEALVRWIKSDGTVIPPGKFIPLFEKNGFVLDVDNRVYELLFEQMHRWLAEGKNVPMLSVNVSRLHLLNERFPAYFSELVDQYGIPHELVEIEITESVFFDNIERMINMISKLRSMRFPISMDDFGTGYSTLNLMKSLPIDILKIDGGFFLKCPLDEKNKAVISAIINLGHSLNLKIVAEGIETEEQNDFISKEHCDFAQGYLHYKPMAMEEFGKLI